MELNGSWGGAELMFAGPHAAVELLSPPRQMAPQVQGSSVPAPTVVLPLDIRPAIPTDVPALLELLDRFARRGLVLPREPGALYRHFREYLVAIAGAEVVGCAGLRVYHHGLAEVVGVAVAEEWQGHGAGRRLVSAVIDEAHRLAIPRIFALTLQEPFFRQLGFCRVSLADVPEKIAADQAEGIDRANCIKVTMIRDLEL
jgi:amino-acid N-acetyltransferase